MVSAVRFRRVLLSALLVSFVQPPASDAQDVEPFKFLHEYVGLHDDQIAAIRNGKAVATILESRTTDEVLVFGSVYIRSTPENIAEKQFFASHYFETALDLTVCVRNQENPERPGFYLITLKGSQQAGLTGLKGGIVRKVAVDRTRSSLERALQATKQKLESRTD